MIPPCVSIKPSLDQSTTFVAKAVGHEALPTFGASELVHGAGAFAVVHEPCENSWYFVITFEAKRSNPNYRAKLTKQIEQLTGAPKVEWVQPLTVRLQRMLGFGDAAATQQDVEAACNEENIEELMAIAPEVAAYVDSRQCNLELVPAACDGLRSGVPALEDCAHELNDPKERFVKILGPCCRGRPPAARDVTKPVGRNDHMGPYTRCTKCRTVFCNSCAADVISALSDKEELANALALARSLPRPKSAPSFQWRQHPERPLPFQVIDQTKIPENDKLAWIQTELGIRDAELPEFAAKFVELFGKKVRGLVPQKNACLKLFKAYSGSVATKESDLEPTARVAFERVWDPHARGRCLECSKELHGPGEFCSAACSNAGLALTCTRCNQNQVKRVTLDPQHDETEVLEKHLICTACDKPLVTGRDDVAQWLRNSQKFRAMLNGHFQMARDDAHEPAWKRRKR